MYLNMNVRKWKVIISGNGKSIIGLFNQQGEKGNEQYLINLVKIVLRKKRRGVKL